MATAVFGTAHLFGGVDDATSHALLAAVVPAGFAAVDTAPSYGFGRSEPEVGAALPPGSGVAVVTKVGLWPVTRPGPAVRVAKAAARRLPAGVQQRLRGGGPRGAGGPGEPAPPAGAGGFDPARVRESVRRSAARLGRIDRLMLHEPAPDDLTDALLDVVAGFLADGTVGTWGVATTPAATAACVARSPLPVPVVHLSVDPFATRPSLPPTVTVVGHGALGAGGAALRRVQVALTDPAAGRAWDDMVRGTRWEGPEGPARALLAHAAGSGVDGVVVATSRPARLAGLREAVEGPPLEPPVAAALGALLARA